MSDTQQQPSQNPTSVPRSAPKPTIRLDRSKPYSECRGERTPDDPHYKVAFWQGRRVGKDMILLPFDAQGILVPDDGRRDPWHGRSVEDKPVVHHPLYTDKMRELVAAMEKRAANPVQQTEVEAALEDGNDAFAGFDPTDDVNLEAWLRGEVRYTPQELRAAAKKRFSRQYQEISQLVVDLVLDEHLVPESAVAPDLAKFLPPRQ